MKKSFRIISLLVGIIFVFVFAACSNQFDELKKSIKVISEEDKNSENDLSEENPEEVTYYVEHCIQNIYDDDYTVESVQIKTGLPDQMTQAEPKPYAGCVTKSVTQKNINADGSTIARIYYDRKYITYTFDADSRYGKFIDNDISKTITKRYGAVVEIPEEVVSEKKLFEFSQWPDSIPKTYGPVNQTFTAQYKVIYYDKITYLQGGTDGSVGTEGSYVYFGVFPQTKCEADVTVIEDYSTRLSINKLVAYLGSDYEYYYRQISSWYKIEPIKWRIVTTNYNNTGKALLVAENILIASAASTYGGIYWNTSPIRSYLNTSFLDSAFITSAKAVIANTKTTLSNSTSTEQVFLLSKNEIENPEYGFSTTESLHRIPTDYAKWTNVDNSCNYGCYVNSYTMNNWWWLRDDSGSWWCIKEGKLGCQGTSYQYVGVVPAITVTLPPQ